MTGIPSVYTVRADYSSNRMMELRNRIGKLSEAQDFEDLTIIGAGSYARQEASEYSDLDVFFLCAKDRAKLGTPRTDELRLFGKVIDIVEDMGFPQFSNDCQYLVVMHTGDMSSHMGSSSDDHYNFFTTRMLLLLESTCIYGDETYKSIVNSVVDSYFRDAKDHSETFQPIFLLNDICRFWKTLLLNYENDRDCEKDTDQEKTKQKVKNFKLKFSRMTTCFASMAAFASYPLPVEKEQVIEQISLTPRQRLQAIPERVPAAEESVAEILEGYAWFLEKTGLSKEKLHAHFSDSEMKSEMSKRATDHGDSMYALLEILDQAPETPQGILRYLVI